jgi:hypothetical protein
MPIQIDESLFLPKIKEFAERNRPSYQDNSVDLGRDALVVAQGWFDEQPWKDGNLEHYNTQRECRIELKRYILSRMSLTDHDRSWFVPSFVWIFVARMVITYIVKLIIEHYWPQLSDEIGLEP